MRGIIFDFRWLVHLLTVTIVVLLIGFAIHITSSNWALLGLLFIPSLEIKANKDN